MQRAAALAGPDAVLLTTDADAVPPPDWILRNLMAIAGGADVVCGRAVIDPDEVGLMAAHLRHDAALERELIALQDGFAALLDPEPHEPAPRHAEAAGASLALTTAAFHRAGGVPALVCGEDRALIHALWPCDARVRHDPAVFVIVSGRTIGRAIGGMANTLRRRLLRQDAVLDEQAEPSRNAWRRYGLRNRTRRCWSGERDPTLASELNVADEQLWTALNQPYFGAAWAMLERLNPVLARQRVRFADLPNELALARGLLAIDKLAAD